jgi:hypothetical protein
MKYVEFERASKRRFITRVDFAEYSFALVLFGLGALVALGVGWFFLEIVAKLGGILL